VATLVVRSLHSGIYCVLYRMHKFNFFTKYLVFTVVAGTEPMLRATLFGHS
jgi:hypothetical protein